MRYTTRALTVCLVALAVLVSSVALAQQRKARRRPVRQPRRTAGLVALIEKNLNLTEEQKAKLKDISQKYAKALREARAALGQVRTEEQRKARAELMRKARQEKKRLSREEIARAIGLTPEQQQKLADLQKKLSELQRKLREELLGVLTAEQQQKLRELLKARRAEAKKKKDGRRGKKRPARRGRRPRQDQPKSSD